jgi:hypothetical protein
MIFTPEAVAVVHHCSSGIPRVINLLCEHCMVGAFVDQQKEITGALVEAVARDFELSEGASASPLAAASAPVRDDKFDLVDALKTLATLADKLRQSEENLPKERKL